MKTVPTLIVGGPSDGVVYDRPPGQTDGKATDGVRVYLYELRNEKMVATGDSYLDCVTEPAEDYEREFAKVLR